MIELEWLSAGWTRSGWSGSRMAVRDREGLALGKLEVVELVCLSTAVTRWSWSGSRLTGCDRLGLALSWLEMFELSSRARKWPECDMYSLRWIEK
jgi:hypothetical protein